MKDDIILNVKDLTVSFKRLGSSTTAIDRISFTLKRGQSLGVVGESGSGKSVTSLSILNLLSYNKAATTSGTISFDKEGSKIDLLHTDQKSIRDIRGNRICMVFQEPVSSFNPVIKCGLQVAEVFRVHHLLDRKSRKKKVLELFRKVRLKDVYRIYDSYPHELSGGQLQRVSIAMALAGEPDILICDEPTTALDVTVQKEIIDLLESLIISENLALIFVSHDLDLVAEICDTVIVMYKGKIVESGELPDIFKHPKHLYTKALLECKPRIDDRTFILPVVKDLMSGTHSYQKRTFKEISRKNNPVLEVKNLTVEFLINELSLFGKKKTFKAVDNVSFNLFPGETLGIVGESGSGKSTIAKCISGLIVPNQGSLVYKGTTLSKINFGNNVDLRRSIQMIFQDPYSSLDPRMTIGQAIAEPIAYHTLRKDKLAVRLRVDELMSKVGIPIDFYDRYPHELSGGQRQRVCIARALSVEPEMLICDECVSALDVSVQAQILNLLDNLKKNLGFQMIFISHDLSVIYYLSDRVLVLKQGKQVEIGTVEEIIHHPKTSYTKKLLNSIPKSVDTI